MLLLLLRAPGHLLALLLYGRLAREPGHGQQVEVASEHRGARLEQWLTQEQLRVANQQFQDELAREGVAWFGFFLRLTSALYYLSVVYQMVWRALAPDQVSVWPDRAELLMPLGWLAVLTLLWAVCRYGFKQEGSRYSATRRLLLCLPSLLFCVQSLAVNQKFSHLIQGKSESVVEDYASLFTLVYSVSFWHLLVAPASPGIKVGVSSLVLYCALLAWSHWESPGLTKTEEYHQVVLAVGFLIACQFIKRSNERKHRALVLALQFQSSVLLAERVQHYQAEFRLEAWRDWGQRRLPEPELLGRSTSPRHSLMTAPAATWLHLADENMHREQRVDFNAFGDCADCMPENSLVQIEGGVSPQELGSVRVGDRVLCSDTLTGSACYIEVVDVDFVDDADPNDWVRLTLSDGTSVTTTEDHPLRVCCRQSLHSVKLAAEVCPVRDSLMSLRLVQNTVVAVEFGIVPPTVSHGLGFGPPRRVSLAVEQGERFSVVVSPAGGTAPVSHLTAVGSADASSSGWWRDGAWSWEHSQRPHERRSLRRSHSEPSVVGRGGDVPPRQPLRL